MSSTIRITVCILLSFLYISSYAQIDYKGQLSGFSTWTPNQKWNLNYGGRYIPELSFPIHLKDSRTIDFVGALNISGGGSSMGLDQNKFNGDIQAYRLWTRFTTDLFEVRIGLQKINFGSATLLRAIQWFDEIDPRDPLKITSGVYGILGRYYFMNNANIWLWSLYGNKDARGLDLLESNPKIPEIGGRIQYPVPHGEIALSYHHRNINTNKIQSLPQYRSIPEDRIALDGKWDLGIGLWFETSLIHQSKNLNYLNNQFHFNLGSDYTFPIGNGIKLVAEHLLSSFDQRYFEFKGTHNTTAILISYPLNLNQTISGSYYYSWENKAFTSFISFEHQFQYISGYIMTYYNSKNLTSQLGEEYITAFSGPALSIMLVYNH